MRRRVAITGMGVVAPLGSTYDELFDNLIEGRSAIQRLPEGIARGLRSPIGAPVQFDGSAHFAAPRLRMLDRVSQLALVAANAAIADAQLDFKTERLERCGVFVGSGMGGAETTDLGYHTLYAERSDRIQPYSVLTAMTNAPAAWIAIDHALLGPMLTYSTACSSSAVAIGEAARRIQCGEADIMIAGGTEAPLVPGVLRAWEAMRTLASEDKHDPAASCRPFAKTRTGLVLAEGAAFVVLEEWAHATARGAPAHAELTGYGLTSDVGHITRPTVDGQARAMRAALESAALPPEVDYINAHGTATLQNDTVETEAIKAVFGAKAYSIPVSSTKSMHGHLLGGAGALEFVIAVMSVKRGVIPPTMHLDSPDPSCDLDYVPSRARHDLKINSAMSNSFAFGGTNAVLIVQSARAGQSQ
jgi:3-oxoacyl-[acyl-carrier-protein] synthase II